MYTLIGAKLSHSYSAIIHKRYFELLQRINDYSLTEVDENGVREIILGRKFDGINVTIPYKKTVIQYLDELSPEACKIGAVNTVKYKDGKIIGYNTDYYGLKLTLEKNDIKIKDKRIVILGTGGASKAVYAVCKDLGAKSVVFVSRKKPEFSEYEVLTYDDKICADVIFNTTPVGMFPNVGVSPLENIPGGTEAIVDLIYNPGETKLMKLAEKQGIKAVNGLYMLVSQGIKSESIWNDEELNTDIIDRIHDELMAEFEKR